MLTRLVTHSKSQKDGKYMWVSRILPYHRCHRSASQSITISSFADLELVSNTR